LADRIEIEVTIRPDGTVELETRGLKGTTCLAETEALEKRLGRVVRREKTSEYYQQPAGTRSSVKRS
jgi:hypothetical protein